MSIFFLSWGCTARRCPHPVLLFPFSHLCSGFTEDDFEKVAIFFDRAVGITETITKKTGTKLADFKKALAHGPQDFPELVALGNEIRDFSRTFPTIGF
jgi:glycine hydroxymethyltransferase